MANPPSNKCKFKVWTETLVMDGTDTISNAATFIFDSIPSVELKRKALEKMQASYEKQLAKQQQVEGEN
ncbi:MULTISPECIES: hypothetical protein [Aeromonas]|uniref:hypothetical protein n=1 Tax=Aeromonas TaxID=642 RepID=UPI0005B3361D|nr:MULTISPECIES: hypothetical protein [Aeromonas]TNH69853.1 hypothetical protein CF142_14190 [Aeromonas caviae]